MGKFLITLIVGASVFGGAAIYYLQVYYYYEEVPSIPGTDVEMTLLINGEVEPILYDDFQGIDGSSSPIRYRGCFTTPVSQATLTDTYVAYDDATPLVAPGWFDCFDAVELGAALEDGRALAFMGTENIKYGIDRVVAVDEDGRGFVWHQINRCGAVVFDGRPAPDDCPKPPEGY